jgi:hypothetical protein
MPRISLFGDHWCDQCQHGRTAVHRIVDWTFDADGHSRASDPLKVLGALYAARVAAYGLVETSLR